MGEDTKYGIITSMSSMGIPRMKGRTRLRNPLVEFSDQFKKYVSEKKFSEAYDVFQNHNEVLLVYYNQIGKKEMNSFYTEAQKEIGDENVLNMKTILPDMISQYKKEIEYFGKQIQAINEQCKLDRQISRKTLDTVFDI